MLHSQQWPPDLWKTRAGGAQDGANTNFQRPINGPIHRRGDNMIPSRIALAALLAALVSQSVDATPFPRHATPAAVDLGAADGVSNAPVTVTIVMKLRNREQLDSLVQSLYTPGNGQYRHFLSRQDFAARFGPSDASVAALTRRFQSAGLSVTRASTTQLKLTGSTAAIQSAFGVQLHAYEVPGTAATHAYRYRAPLGQPQVGADLGDSVQAVLGLDTRPRFRPHMRRGAASSDRVGGGVVKLHSAGPPATPDEPGLWTVVDFTQYYNVNPLYQNGIDGHKQTIGIVTLASFTQKDAFRYWKSLGLNTASNRIKEVQIDGGSGPPSDESGSDETALDVEQSGGIAPGAKMIVYEAPNTDQGFVDAFATAVDDNDADTISTSWGQWEYLDVTDPKVVDPVSGHKTSSLSALNDILTQAAVQGQSTFAAAGDCGAYDAFDVFPVPDYTNVLSVDDPAAQPLITAAGGTTLPGPQSFSIPGVRNPYIVNIATEQAWGWDYLLGLCSILQQDPITCEIYPAGGGGGVSVYFPLPAYQSGIAGMARTASNQALYNDTGRKPRLIVKLPAGFAGRNVPDLSVNSDPDTGYTIYYTSDQAGFEVETFIGGTSFASPQLNGVTALLDQGLGGRVGLLNFPLYDLARRNLAYAGPNAPLRDIKRGDNWFYNAQPGYDQATGLGVPNVANLLQTLQNELF